MPRSHSLVLDGAHYEIIHSLEKFVGPFRIFWESRNPFHEIRWKDVLESDKSSRVRPLQGMHESSLKDNSNESNLFRSEKLFCYLISLSVWITSHYLMLSFCLFCTRMAPSDMLYLYVSITTSLPAWTNSILNLRFNYTSKKLSSPVWSPLTVQIPPSPSEAGKVS